MRLALLNIIAAMLNRARTDAVGIQKPYGVAFIYNPNTQQSSMAEVQLASCPAWVSGQSISSRGYCCITNSSGQTFYYINAGGQTTLGVPPNPTTEGDQSPLQAVYGPPVDIVPDTDLVPLPAGVGVQTVCNCTPNASGNGRLTDGYLNFGVILFDGKGRLANATYGVSRSSNLCAKSGLGSDYPKNVPGIGIYNGYTTTSYNFGVGSQFGLVVYQRDAFLNQNFPIADPAYNYANNAQQGQYQGSTQQQEENWLDQNATPLLIDRYTGTLIRAE